jgi:hypothetical protein
MNYGTLKLKNDRFLKIGEGRTQYIEVANQSGKANKCIMEP